MSDDERQDEIMKAISQVTANSTKHAKKISKYFK